MKNLQSSLPNSLRSKHIQQAADNHTTKSNGADYYAPGSNNNPLEDCFLRSYINLGQ